MHQCQLHTFDHTRTGSRVPAMTVQHANLVGDGDATLYRYYRVDIEHP